MSKNDYYIDKWSFLLEGLTDTKRERYKFSKVYENSSMQNSFDDFKLVASILYKFFKKYNSFSLSNSKKNRLNISEIEENSIFDYDKILIDFFEGFTNTSSNKIVSHFEEEDLTKINHLRADHENGKIVISVVY